jgi:hypothetical protein
MIIGGTKAEGEQSRQPLPAQSANLRFACVAPCLAA